MLITNALYVFSLKESGRCHVSGHLSILKEFVNKRVDIYLLILPLHYQKQYKKKNVWRWFYTVNLLGVEIKKNYRWVARWIQINGENNEQRSVYKNDRLYDVDY